MAWSDIIAAGLGRLGSSAQYTALHRAWLYYGPGGLAAFWIDAPFGRFAVKDSILNVNSKLGWFVMEIVSPVAFALSLLGPALDSTPLTLIQALTFGSPSFSKLSTLSTPTKLLAGAYLVHYANRAVISLFRMPQSRSPMNLVIPIAGIVFNFFNGNLMGSWLGGRTSDLTATTGAVPQDALSSPIFWAGLGIWALGLVGNIVSDEIVYSLRRPSADGKPKPRYSIPRGFLFDRPFGGISFPNYFCEWCEWTGFAIAATCCTLAPNAPRSSEEEVYAYMRHAKGLLQQGGLGGGVRFLLDYRTYLTPPFLFVYNEMLTMIPRAIKGHAWYHDKFKGDYPKQRKAMIPGIW